MASGFFFFRGIPASQRFFLPVGVRLLFSCMGGAETQVRDREELSGLTTGAGEGAGVEAGVGFLRGLNDVVVLLLAVLAVEFFRGLFTFIP